MNLRSEFKTIATTGRTPAGSPYYTSDEKIQHAQTLAACLQNHRFEFIKTAVIAALNGMTTSGIAMHSAQPTGQILLAGLTAAASTLAMHGSSLDIRHQCQPLTADPRTIEGHLNDFAVFVVSSVKEDIKTSVSRASKRIAAGLAGQWCGDSPRRTRSCYRCCAGSRGFRPGGVECTRA